MPTALSPTVSALTSPRRRYDAVLCDIDGCLCEEAGGPLDLPRLAEVAAYNHAAIHKRDRPVVTLCTGRPVPFAECLTRVIGNVTLPVIAENGVWLYHPSGNRWVMDERITADHRAAVAELSAWVLERYGARGVQLQPGKVASLSPYHPDRAVITELAPAIRQWCEARRLPLRISATWQYVNCDLDFISKATGIERFLQATGLDPARLAGIGDTLGDRAIAERVAFFGCPQNRDPALDPHAHRIARGDHLTGVLELLSSWVG